MLIVTGKNKLEAVLKDLWAEAVKRVEGELRGIKTTTDLADKVKSLRGDVEKLEAEKARSVEDMARREREVEHKIGLERKRQEMEAAQQKKDADNAAREARLSVREENMKADRERFEGQMNFHNERFAKEVSYLKEIIGQLAERLPTTELSGTVTAKRGR